VPRDLNTEEKISKLELRVQESKDDIVHMKQEIRNALFEISAMKDACREPTTVESTMVGRLGIRHGSAYKYHGHGAQNGVFCVATMRMLGQGVQLVQRE
jgi:hypothetical protein